MKEFLSTITLYTVLIGGLVAGNWFGQTELLRLSVWITWALTITILIAVCSSSKELFKELPSGIGWKRGLYGSHLILLILTGWMCTATVFAIAWVALWWKRKEWEESQETEE